MTLRIIDEHVHFETCWIYDPNPITFTGGCLVDVFTEVVYMSS